MSEVPQRFEHIRRSARLGRFLAVVGIGILLVVGAYLFTDDLGPWAWFKDHLFAFGVLAGVCILIATFIFLWILVNLFLKVEGNLFRSYGILRDVQASIERQRDALEAISQNVQLSDVVRSVTHRSRERNALRLAINEEIIRGDWEAAYALVELLESRHGYRNEAARLREEVDQSRGLEGREQLQKRIDQIKASMESHDWDRARREMDRLGADHPTSAEVAELPKLFARLRNEHKRRLLKEWDETVQRNEVDRGISILKELDQYLTPNEAAALQESARGVFRAKLHNLHVQFSLAVTGQDWGEAYQAGQQIMREFPNSRMALEVKERIHLLAQRAAETVGGPKAAELTQD
ncbi:MAG: hypothetical protein ACE5EC_04605 [Phycisphaerae bacterium]